MAYDKNRPLSSLGAAMLQDSPTDAGRRAQPKKPAGPTLAPSVTVGVAEVAAFRDGLLADERHATATAAERLAIAIEVSNLVEDASYIEDPNQLVEVYQRVASVSPDAANQLLENASYAHPETVQFLHEQRQIEFVNASLVADETVAYEAGIAEATAQIEEVQRASANAGVDWLAALDAGEDAEANGFGQPTARQSAEMVRASNIAEERREQRASRFDSWLTPAVTSRGQREDLAKEREAYVNTNTSIEYRNDHANPEAVAAMKADRQVEMREAILGRVPSDLPTHEKWKTPAEAVQAKPKQAPASQADRESLGSMSVY
jgi:hypothetical protein